MGKINRCGQKMLNDLWIDCSSVAAWVYWLKFWANNCQLELVPLEAIPNAVSNATATCTNNNVVISWTWTATTYEIREWATLIVGWLTNTTYTITWASNSSHTYTITPYNWAVAWTWATVSVTCSWWGWWCTAPANPTWFLGSSTWLTVNLIWNFTAWAVGWYKLYKNNVLIQTFPSNTTTSYSYTETAWGTYTYKVTSIDWTCESTWSTTSVTVASCTTPAGVTNIAVANTTWWSYVNGNVVVNWTAVPSWATTYRIYEWATLLASVTHPTNTATILSPAPWNHTYIVKAVNGWCESTWTSITFTTQTCNLLAPAGFTVGDAYGSTYQCGTPILNWWAVSGATSYDVFQGGTFMSNVAWLTYSAIWYPVWWSVTYSVQARNSVWCVSPQSSVTITTWQCAAWNFYMSTAWFGWHRMFDPDGSTNSSSWLWFSDTVVWEPLNTNVTYLFDWSQLKRINRWLYTQQWPAISTKLYRFYGEDKLAMIWSKVYSGDGVNTSDYWTLVSIDLLTGVKANLVVYNNTHFICWTAAATDGNVYVVMFDTNTWQMRIDKVNATSWAIMNSNNIVAYWWATIVRSILVAWTKVFVSIQDWWTSVMHVFNESGLTTSWVVSWANADRSGIVFWWELYIWNTNNLQHVNTASQTVTTTPAVWWIWFSFTNIWLLSTDWTYIYWHWTTNTWEWRVIRFTPNGASTTWVSTVNYTGVGSSNWPQTFYL